MSMLLDGPCQGSFLVKRSPVYLRAVRNIKTGDTDLLDQLVDTPGKDEEVYVYKMEPGSNGTAHIFARGKGGKSLSGWYAMANYRYLSEVDGEKLRDNALWQAWCVREDSKEGRCVIETDELKNIKVRAYPRTKRKIKEEV